MTLSAFAPVLWRRCWTSSKPAARHCCGRSMGQTDRHRLLHPGTVLISEPWVIWLCQGKCLALTASLYPHGRNKAIMRWVFQLLPRPVGFIWKLIYKSGSQTQGCVVRGAVHQRCCRPSPVRFTAPCTVTRSPHREEVGLTD